MPFSSLKYTYTPATQRTRTYVPSVLKEWHQAMRLGFEVEMLSIDGVSVHALALERLNFWIAAQGAWRCSIMPFHDSVDALEDVLRCPVRPVPVGPNGAGRWSSWAAYRAARPIRLPQRQFPLFDGRIES